MKKDKKGPNKFYAPSRAHELICHNFKNKKS